MQNNQKIVFNKQTLRFETVKKRPFTKWILILSSLLFGGITTSYLSFTSKHSTEDKNDFTAQELSKLEKKYALLENQLNKFSGALDKLHKKDAQIYSVVMGVTPVEEDIWQGGTGGKQPGKSSFANLFNLNINKIEDKADKLNHQLSLQTKSLDKMLAEALAHEEYLKCIPSIKPVKAEALNRDVTLLSGFGRRIHPVFKIWKKHTGIDFSCPRGTQIVASGKGVIEKINGNGRGYGKHVLINHGYGIQTLYAHMSEIDVRVGQKVERGTPIGKVGSTGTATAPHLHYEVHKQGTPINPIDYVLDGLNPTEYNLLLKQAAVEGKSMD